MGILQDFESVLYLIVVTNVPLLNLTKCFKLLMEFQYNSVGSVHGWL